LNVEISPLLATIEQNVDEGQEIAVQLAPVKPSVLAVFLFVHDDGNEVPLQESV